MSLTEMFGGRWKNVFHKRQCDVVSRAAWTHPPLSVTQPVAQEVEAKGPGDGGDSGALVLPLTHPFWPFSAGSQPSLQYTSPLSMGLGSTVTKLPPLPLLHL